MTTLTILTCVLVAAVTLPFLFLAAYGLASYFELAIADRLLDAVALSLKVQWILGCVVNLVGGVALVGLGIWALQHFSTPVQQLASVAIALGGLWRAWKGFAGIPRKNR